MTAGIFTIIGVLLGSSLALVAQLRVARRGESFAVAERLRTEQMDAFTALAAGVMDARRTQIDRWYERQRRSTREDPAYLSSKAESYRTRNAARRDFYRTKLVCRDPALVALAEAAVDSLGAIHKAHDKSDMEMLADKTRVQVERFVDAASLAL